MWSHLLPNVWVSKVGIQRPRCEHKSSSIIRIVSSSRLQWAGNVS